MQYCGYVLQISYADYHLIQLSLYFWTRSNIFSVLILIPGKLKKSSVFIFNYCDGNYLLKKAFHRWKYRLWISKRKKLSILKLYVLLLTVLFVREEFHFVRVRQNLLLIWNVQLTTAISKNVDNKIFDIIGIDMRYKKKYTIDSFRRSIASFSRPCFKKWRRTL